MPEELSSRTRQVLHELAQRSWQIAEDHGWHEQQKIDGVRAKDQQDDRYTMELSDATYDRTVGEHLILWVSEIAEALEELRNGQPLDRVYINADRVKPEGFPVEIADIFIRIFDSIVTWDIESKVWEGLEKKLNYNETREIRHGGKAL